MVLWLDSLLQDFRAAARGLRRYPITAAVAVLSLAGGIGAATVTLTVRDTVFRKPPALYAEPEELSRVQVERTSRTIMPLGGGIPAELFAAWRETEPSLAGAVARGAAEARFADRTLTVAVRAATPDLFDVLGVEPQIGRPATAPGEAALSHGLWQRLADLRPDVIGRTLWIDDRPHTIVGVMPAQFWYSDMNSPVWTALDPRAPGPEAFVDTIARRTRGESHEALASRLRAGLAAYAARQPAGERELHMRVSGVEGTPLGHQVALVLPYVLGTSVLLTLLIACANVAILMISQWTTREREIAIRAAIGAGRFRIVRALLAESILIALLSGASGVLATVLLRAWVVARGPADTAFFDLSIEPHVYLTIAVVTMACGFAIGLAPALYETRRLQTNPLRTMAVSDRVRQRWRHALVVLEITVTVALLVETTAMIDAFWRTRDRDFGFDTTPLVSAQIEHRQSVPLARLLDAVRSVPGVVEAGASTARPFAARGRDVQVSAQPGGGGTVAARTASVDPRFFTALGVPLRAGRFFTEQETRASHVVIVNEALALRLFATARPAASRLWLDGTPYDVVGIVADYSTNAIQPQQRDPRLFLPIQDSTGAGPPLVHLTIRAGVDPAPLVDTVRRALRDSAASDTRVRSVETFDQFLRIVGQEILAGSAPLLPLIAIGILLTGSGVYSVLSFAITRRSRELAVRMAIGARPRDLVRLVAGHSAGLIALGTAAGVGATYALSRVVRAGGGAGSVFDPQLIAFVLPVAAIAALGAIATFIPSRRAARIDPAVLLRAE